MTGKLIFLLAELPKFVICSIKVSDFFCNAFLVNFFLSISFIFFGSEQNLGYSITSLSKFFFSKLDVCIINSEEKHF